MGDVIRHMAEHYEQMSREQKQKDAVELWDLLESNEVQNKSGVRMNALEFVRNELPKHFVDYDWLEWF